MRLVLSKIVKKLKPSTKQRNDKAAEREPDRETHAKEKYVESRNNKTNRERHGLCQNIESTKSRDAQCDHLLAEKLRKLDRFKTPPPYLLKLFYEHTDEGKVFRNFPPSFNNGMCLTSLLAQERNRAQETHFTLLQLLLLLQNYYSSLAR